MTRFEPQQRRAHETRERILAAAREVYEEKGRDRFITSDVAARSGRSIGTIYRYFENDVDLLDVIAPDRDYPTVDQLDRIERYIQREGQLPAGTPREIITFLEKL